MNRPPLKPGDVYPAHVLRDEYGMNAENRPIITVNVDEVPEDLRELIPAVERWAIPCDVTRGDYFDKQPEGDIAKFWHDVNPFVERINGWLNELGEDVREWPSAAVHFLYLLTAHSAAWQPTAEEKLEMEQRFAAQEHRLNLKKANEQGVLAFQAKDWKAVIDALAPFAEELDKVMSAKLAYAKKNVKA